MAFPEAIHLNKRPRHALPLQDRPQGAEVRPAPGKPTLGYWLSATIDGSSGTKSLPDWPTRGKMSMGWFYGFKLHLIVNDRGELITFYLTPGNIDDRRPVPRIAKKLWGQLFGDKGYISQPLFDQLFEQGVQLTTPIRENMKNRLMPLMDKVPIFASGRALRPSTTS